MSTLAATNLKHASSASNNIVLDSSGNATFAGTAVPASSFLRNRIINGGMQIWQRGTSFSGFNSIYTADRWLAYTPSGNPTVSQSTDVPLGFTYSAIFTGNGVDSIQRIESFNTVDLVGSPVTLSFWMKQTVGAGSNSITITLDYPNAKDTYGATSSIASTTITPTSSWVLYYINFSALPAGVANGLMLSLFATSSASSSTFYLTGVQLEVGTAATPFERRQYGQELALCQRYFVNMNGTTNNYQPVAFGWCYTTTQGSWITYLPVSMRTTPTLSHSGTIYAQNLSINVSSFAGPFSQVGSIVEGDFTLASSTTSGNSVFLRWNNVASGSRSFSFSAEL